MNARILRPGILAVAALAGACLLSPPFAHPLHAQDDVYVPDHPLLVVRATSGPASGARTLTASCREGEILLGGGYRSERPELDAPHYLSFEASYPSGPRAWTVTVLGPASGSAGPTVTVEAYCLTRPIAQVRIVESAAITAAADPFGRFFRSTSSISCPAGSVLTAGGHRTTRTVSHAGHYNAWVTRSLPVASEGTATGWRVDVAAIQWTPPPAPPATRAYAVCASPPFPTALLDGQVVATDRPVAQQPAAQQPAAQPTAQPAHTPRRGTIATVGSGSITAGTLVTRTVAPLTQFGYRHHEGDAVCPAGQVAVGGGYEFVGDTLIPHNVYRTAKAAVSGSGGVAAEPVRPAEGGERTSPRDLVRMRTVQPRADMVVAHADGPRLSVPNPFGGWGSGAVYGAERGGSGAVAAHVPCIKLPEIPLTVRIVSPGDQTAPRLAYRDGLPTGRTQPIHFQAIAGDAFGNYVPDAEFTWTIQGEALGSGESFTADLPADACSVDRRTVRVRATDRRGNAATAEVTILVGGIC